MGKKVWALTIAALVLVGLAVVCNSPTSTPATPLPSSTLALKANDVANWDSVPAPAFYSSTSALAGYNNGDAYTFENIASYSDAMSQTMSSKTDNTFIYNGLTLSFSNSANSDSVFNVRKRSKAPNPVVLSSATGSFAIGDTSVMQGITVFAHFHNLYIEFTLLHPSYANRALAIAEAVKFIQIFENKVNGI